ncbi:uncharacterized protein BX663DRAFT_485653 [Cokeromyces recurvatus]|uniref:uncharacterized protein n=1 Tax=Cokeromyces recurvatus TaxID=90255 RepID=UPI0022203C76|nr:uncharacterized protein BX663DRAFT_485653 [Cokeromyces recurvatus]KAI7903506.1 hypothetical protein BX663DRAFT_485653 [Cokeromyces recurvatus]
MFPKVIVFAVKGFSSRSLLNDLIIEESCPYYTAHKQFWANSIHIYSLDSISSSIIDQSSMTPIVALSYFLCSQQKSIMALDENEDEELRKIYKIAYRSFLQYTTIENSLIDLANDVLEKTNKQFEKIMKCAQENSESSIRKIRAYAKNGVEFTEKRQKLFFEKEQDTTVTPIETIESADLFFYYVLLLICCCCIIIVLYILVSNGSFKKVLMLRILTIIFKFISELLDILDNMDDMNDMQGFYLAMNNRPALFTK